MDTRWLQGRPRRQATPRLRLKDSLDKILACGYDRNKVVVAVESKVFGIGVESYTVGSNEFYQNYAAKNDICCLLDNRDTITRSNMFPIKFQRFWLFTINLHCTYALA